MHFRAKQIVKVPDMLSVPRNLHLKKIKNISLACLTKKNKQNHTWNGVNVGESIQVNGLFLAEFFPYRTLLK